LPSIGIILILIGGYLLYGAVKNIKPIATLSAILANPGSARSIIANGAPISAKLTGPTIGENRGAAGSGAAVVAYARAQLGKPYVFGAAGPDAFDCSGLTQQAIKAGYPDITLVHFVPAQAVDPRGIAVKRDDLQEGDLIFPDATGAHVGVYSGNGNIIHAPQENDVVKEQPIWAFFIGRRFGSTSGAKGKGSSGAGGAGGGGGGV